MNWSFEYAKRFGYLTFDEVCAIRILAKSIHCQNPLFVTVGAGSGTSSLAMYEGCPNANMVTIDIRFESPLGGLQNEKNAFDEAGYKLPFQILGKSQSIDVKSLIVDRYKKNIDFLFIDGGHLLDEITGDINNFLPFVAKKGIIAFHDYNSKNWEDVAKAVDNYFKHYNYLFHVDTLIAFRNMMITS